MPQARLIDGKAYAERMRASVAAAAAAFADSQALVPGLAVVQLGEDAASTVYVRSKGEQTRAAGMHSVTHRLPAETSQGDLLALVAALNGDPTIHGVLVQLPLPAHVDIAAVLAAVHPDKDVDGFHVVSAGRLATGRPGLVPCTPLGCLILLRDVLGDFAGARAVVVGRSNVVGKPMALLLLGADATVTVAHSRSRDLPALCREADILVAAVGRPEMVRGSWVRPGAVVVDVGVNRVASRDPERAAAGKTRLVGDVAFAEAVEVASAITPVPGGVGPMTIACLLRNTVAAAYRSRGLEPPTMD